MPARGGRASKVLLVSHPMRQREAARRRTALPSPKVAAEAAEEVDDLNNVLPRLARGFCALELALFEAEALLHLLGEAASEPFADALAAVAVVEPDSEDFARMCRLAFPAAGAARPDGALPGRERVWRCRRLGPKRRPEERRRKRECRERVGILQRRPGAARLMNAEDLVGAAFGADRQRQWESMDGDR